MNSVPLCFHNTKSNTFNENAYKDWKLKHRGTEDTEWLVAFSEKYRFLPNQPTDSAEELYSLKSSKSPTLIPQEPTFAGVKTEGAKLET